ncbi:MAG: hypothetical protein M1828_001891 [Chrysothrix sp. TS-e1954]|nr:MAG: hypothetical protein M1828_001891 [Chrysothrix sp. TS-e1954]
MAYMTRFLPAEVCLNVLDKTMEGIVGFHVCEGTGGLKVHIIRHDSQRPFGQALYTSAEDDSVLQTLWSVSLAFDLAKYYVQKQLEAMPFSFANCSVLNQFLQLYNGPLRNVELEDYSESWCMPYVYQRLKRLAEQHPPPEHPPPWSTNPNLTINRDLPPEPTQSDPLRAIIEDMIRSTPPFRPSTVMPADEDDDSSAFDIRFRQNAGSDGEPRYAPVNQANLQSLYRRRYNFHRLAVSMGSWN